MPKRIACEMKCDRCGAVWYEDYTPGEPEPATPSMAAILKVPGKPDRVVKYDTLCEKCSGTVANYVDSLDLDPEARKKPRAKKKGDAQGNGQSRPPEVMKPADGGEARQASSAERARSS